VEVTAELSAFAERSAKVAEVSGEVSIPRTDCVEGGEMGEVRKTVDTRRNDSRETGAYGWRANSFRPLYRA